jgi:hypothetical protein
MPAEKGSLSESVSATFMELRSTALTLNAISDELGKAVNEIDESIKRLNLGIEVWEDIARDYNDENGFLYALEIGYAKIGGKWGFSLRESEGDDPAELDIKIWLYNDAPRSLRLKAIEKIPGLLKQLSNEAKETATALQEQLKSVLTVAETLKLAAAPQNSTGARQVLMPAGPITGARQVIMPAVPTGAGSVVHPAGPNPVANPPSGRKPLEVKR